MNRTGGRMTRIGWRATSAALAATLWLTAGAWAGIEEAGTTAGNFLSLGAGARTLAMGGAVLGLGDDAGAAAWNPASLGWVNGTEAALSHAGLPNGSLQEWGIVGGRVGHSQTRWAVAGLYQGEGSIPGRDATGAPTGNISVSSMAIGATLAQQFGDRATLGLAGKAVREDLSVVTGSGFTLDAGFLVRSGGFGIGVAAQNLGGHMSYGSTSYPFPTSYGAGVGYERPGAGLRVGVDANFPRAYHPDLRAGVEWLYQGALALRAGYRHELGSDADPLSGPSFGVGAGHRGMWLDYGYLIPGDGAGQHRLGLRVRLGASEEPEDAAARPSPSGEFDWARDGSRLTPTKRPKR